jgi:toxin ParE1/3/4
MRIQYRRQAQADIERIQRYLATLNPQGARKVLESIRSAIEFISPNPDASPQTSDPAVRMKVVIQYPYKIFYVVHRGFAQILHIRHSARRPWDRHR